jgi:hypothetical protein
MDRIWELSNEIAAHPEFHVEVWGMDRSVWTWNDLSPEDGCTFVAFAMVATSLTEVAQAVSRIPNAQNRTVGKLLAKARARRVTGDIADLAQAHPGEILWLEDIGSMPTSWPPVADLGQRPTNEHSARP